jgi:hypothetical protein
VESRLVLKLGCWRFKMLSYGDRFVLVNFVLTSLPMFMLSFWRFQKGLGKY